MHCDARALSLVSLVFGEVFFGGSPSLHDLFLHFFIYICIYICISVCHAPRPPGQATSSKWRLTQFSECRLQTLGAEAGRDLDKSTTQFYQVRLTTAPRLVQFA